MRVILLQNVENLGKAGEIREVSEGYARNFLLPKKLVGIATDNVVKEAQAKREREEKEQKENIEKSKQLANRIKNKKLKIKAKDRNGKLFGKIGAKEIVALLRTEDISVSEKAIVLENSIKKVGSYRIKLKLSPETETEIILIVESEK